MPDDLAPAPQARVCRRPSKAAASLLVLLLIAAEQTAHCAVPADELLDSLRPAADVNDFAGVLTPAQREQLEQRCRELRARTGAQLAVVVLPSLEGGDIDDFTVRLFERWKVGEAGKDNGVMLLVALEDRKARIEVGYGLEPILPDILAGRILREQLFPHFREGRYYEGLSAAVHRIAALIERNEPARVEPAREEDRKGGGSLLLVVILLFLTAIPAIAAGTHLRRAQFRRAIFDLRLPILAIIVAVIARLSLAMIVFILVTAVAGVLFGSIFHRAMQPRVRRRSRGPWSGWGFGPSMWGGGGFGGGFGGGGGSFGGGSWGGFGGGRSGGGGASGGW